MNIIIIYTYDEYLLHLLRKFRSSKRYKLSYKLSS